MTKEERLHLKIANKERIVLSYGVEFVRITAILISLLSISVALLVFYHFRISFITAIVAGTILFTYLIFFLTIKKYVSASIKGEMLITQDLFNINKVTSLKSIRSISSTTFFGINYTTVTFKLDGVKYNVRIVKKIDPEQIENEQIIKTAMAIAS